MTRRIYLSPPHMSGEEQELVADAFTSNWVAPLGPHVDAFEHEFAEVVGAGHAAALSSGTAALHLSLVLLGVQRGDTVFVSSFTFIASVSPIIYCGATPVFIDSERESWNMDPALLDAALDDASRAGRLPKAVILVHLYGQPADLERISAICAAYGVPLIEDAAEALGARHKLAPPGAVGRFGAFSFNGNKIITTSGGGMLVSNDGAVIEQARKLAAHAREVAPHYQHDVIGYNYRLSNILAAVGRGQLRNLEERVSTRRGIFDHYRAGLGEADGIEFMPEAPWGRHSRWLSCIVIDPARFGANCEQVRLALEAENIEARPLWKPMHMQPVFEEATVYGGSVSAGLFNIGLCLPSGSALTEAEQQRVIDVILRTGRRSSRSAASASGAPLASG